MDSLPDFDRRRLEDLKSLVHDDLTTLRDIVQQQAAEKDPLERRRLRQQAERVREDYNNHCQEYAVLLRKEIPTRFAAGEQALIQTIVQRLNPDQLDLTRTALQEADRHPDTPELTQLLAELVAALPSIQQELAAKNMPEANHVAQVAQVIQVPTADIKQKLKLSVPLIPLLLSYETEFNLNLTADLKAAWERLKERFHPT